MKAKIAHWAAIYAVSRGTMDELVDCETNGTYDPTVQSFASYDRDHPAWGVKKGDRELSFGLAQIHLPAHPEVTLEEAKDADFSLRFMAEHLAAGDASMWSCWRELDK